MGGFATNGVNMTKLESYQLGGEFTATQFFSDIEGHPDDKNVALALEELAFFSTEVDTGVYPRGAGRLPAGDEPLRCRGFEIPIADQQIGNRPFRRQAQAFRVRAVEHQPHVFARMPSARFKL